MDVPYDRPYDINSDSAPGSINDSNLLGNINSPDPNNKSWFLRTFGQLNKGALRGAIFSLVASAIGAGCLTLPLVFESQGIILAVFLLAISIFISYYSLISIALAEEKHKKYNYPALTEVVLGMKWRYLLEISLILFVFGTIIAYQIMIGFILPSIGNSLNIDISGPSNRIAILCVVNVLMTPLSMFRDLSSLRFFTLFSTFSLALISLLIIAEFPMYALESSLSGVNWIKFDLKIINSFNLCLFSVNCHSNFSQVQGELFNTNIRRIKKVSMRSMGALFFTYFALGLFGYLSTIGNTPNLIIMRKAPKMVSNDFLMVIGRVLMVIILIVAVPIGIPSCRRAIIKLVFKQTGNDCPLWMHMLVTETLLLASLGVAIVFPEILVMFSILGGFLGGIIMILIPSKRYLALLRTKSLEYTKFKTWAINGTAIVLFIIGTLGAILVLVQDN